MFSLLCHSYEAMRKRKELFAKVVVVLYEQVRQLPKDFFVCELSEHNFVGTCLQALFDGFEQDGVARKVRSRGAKLREFVKAEMGLVVRTEKELM